MGDWSDNSNVTEETRNAVEWGRKVERERIVERIRRDMELCGWDEVLMVHPCPSCGNSKRLLSFIEGHQE